MSQLDDDDDDDDDKEVDQLELDWITWQRDYMQNRACCKIRSSVESFRLVTHGEDATQVHRYDGGL